MAGRDNRINATLGSVTRTVGNDAQDLAELQRRRAAPEKQQRPQPEQSFAEVLAHGGAPRADVGDRALAAKAGAPAALAPTDLTEQAARPAPAAPGDASARAEEGIDADETRQAPARRLPPGRGKTRLIRG